MIAIIDYGVGNLRSVQKAFEFLGHSVVISSDPKEISDSDAIVLPGVGAFPDAMESLKDKGLDIALVQAENDGKPILGICLGMQLLFDKGYEIRECDGLGFIKGSIRKLQSDVKIPHMGWNDIRKDNDCALLKGIEEGSYVYFVHSFHAELKDESNLNASTIYGGKVPAIVSKNNVFGIQFHPEKSSRAGFRLLRNFIDGHAC